jgi:ferredoxin-NADP reductase
VQPGTTVRVQGPFGDFLPGVQDGPQLWVAGGIGVSPFVAALRAGSLAQPTTLLVLLRDARADAFAVELQQLAGQQPRLTLVLRSSRDAGVDLPPLLDAVPGLAQRQVLACGPGPLLQVLAAALAERGVPATALHAESFDFR